MTPDELKSLARPPTFKVGLPWLEDVFQYSTIPGELPAGTQITVTGEPGAGKTRFGLQLLNAIAEANPHLSTEMWSFEATGPQLADLTEALEIDSIGTFETGRLGPVIDLNSDTKASNLSRLGFKPDTVYLIDSADYWASMVFNKQWPTDEMARMLDTARRSGITVIMIHHKTKQQRALSGSATFRKVSDVILELEKHDDTHVTLSTKNKNRYCGKTSTKRLVHTSKGLKLAPPTGFEALIASVRGLIS